MTIEESSHYTIVEEIEMVCRGCSKIIGYSQWLTKKTKPINTSEMGEETDDVMNFICPECRSKTN
jgi:hypothetical protein